MSEIRQGTPEPTLNEVIKKIRAKSESLKALRKEIDILESKFRNEQQAKAILIESYEEKEKAFRKDQYEREDVL